MANGETPPVKERLEMPTATQKTDTGLTPGLLKVLHKQVYSILPFNKVGHFIDRFWLVSY